MAGLPCFEIRRFTGNARARDLEDDSRAIAAQHRRTLRGLITGTEGDSIG